MTQTTEQGLDPSEQALKQASEWFIRLRSEGAPDSLLTDFRKWIELSPEAHKRAYREVNNTWKDMGRFASAPEIMIGRRDALEGARLAAQGRWSASDSRAPARTRRAWTVGLAAVVMLVSLGLWWKMQADTYSTGVGERRALILADGSVVTLDARSRIRVTYTEKERSIALERGQARFDVAKDRQRPFRVQAGGETVTALGTQFNVEIVNHNVLVTMIEGQVAVAPPPVGQANPVSAPVELTAGEALHVHRDGKTTRIAKANVERAIAWQQGKIFFDNEPLSSAAERINRYAREQIEVDPSVAGLGISGGFNAGDSSAFVDAITTYFPVKVEQSGGATLRLTTR